MLQQESQHKHIRVVVVLELIAAYHVSGQCPLSQEKYWNACRVVVNRVLLSG
jgi:hypothetical protein